MGDNDFATYYVAAHRSPERAAISIETPLGYLYPPPLAVLLAPATLVSQRVAAIPWVLLPIAAIFGSLLLCVRRSGSRGAKPGGRAY